MKKQYPQNGKHSSIQIHKRYYSFSAIRSQKEKIIILVSSATGEHCNQTLNVNLSGIILELHYLWQGTMIRLLIATEEALILTPNLQMYG